MNEKPLTTERVKSGRMEMRGMEEKKKRLGRTREGQDEITLNEEYLNNASLSVPQQP